MKAKKLFVAVFALMALSFGALSPALVISGQGYAQTFKESACDGLQQVGGGNACTGNEAETRVNSLIANIVNLLSFIVGIVAVIMIVIAGFRYITSGGDSSKVSGAKSALIYAIVGLIIVALAQLIVQFVLNKV
jgi:hypothetical protein